MSFNKAKACPKCGFNRFSANQLCRCDIIVDSEGEFVENNTADGSVYIYEAENPYGPYICKGCGAEYDDLDGELIEKDRLVGRKVISRNIHGLSDTTRQIIAEMAGEEGIIVSFTDADLPQVKCSSGEILTLDPGKYNYEILEPEEVDDEEEESEMTIRILLKDITSEELNELTSYMDKHGIDYDKV